MVFNRLKAFVKKRRGKETSQPCTQEECSNTTDGFERTETQTGSDAVRTQPVTAASAGEPVTTSSTREQSTASQKKQESTAKNAGDKEKLGVNIFCAGKNPVVELVSLLPYHYR